MKNKFKFELKEKVFVVGLAGLAVVTGRGVMSFVSGGTLNMYQIEGAHQGIVQEAALFSMKEGSVLSVPETRKDRR